LPPRAARMVPASPAAGAALPPIDPPPAAGDRLLQWVDRLLSR
jgi:hypothetical protein